MCNIGKIRRIIANEEKPTTAMEAIITSVPIKLRELVRVRRIHPTKPKELNDVERVQRLESKEHKR